MKKAKAIEVWNYFDGPRIGILEADQTKFWFWHEQETPVRLWYTIHEYIPEKDDPLVATEHFQTQEDLWNFLSSVQSRPARGRIEYAEIDFSDAKW